MLKPKKAFTLIELLVVIAIIGILATVSIISLTNARAKSRDAKRAGDMKQIQTALELFFNDNNRYPTVTEWATGQIYSTSTTGTSTYMQIIPSAPTPNDGSCTSNQNAVSYSPAVEGTSYSVSFCLGGNTGTLTSGPKCLTPGGIVDWDCSCGDPVIDSRDLQSYPTVKIGGQCWLAKNMNYGVMIDVGAEQSNDGVFEKYCYNNNASDECDTYGGLYQWSEALQLGFSCNAVDCDSSPADPCCVFSVPRQGVCPTGWHIPSDTDWTTLARFVINDSNCDPNSGCFPAGTYLKSVAWGDGSDDSFGFTALSAGYRVNGGSFEGLGAYTGLWSTAVSGGPAAIIRSLSLGTVGLYRGASVRVVGFSVRCLKD